MIRNLVAASALVFAVPAFAAESYKVEPVGNSSFSAVFDATFGERINAVSSELSCDVSLDEKAGTFSGTCSVPLASIMVDNNETKSEHFHQWATNKKGDPKKCRLEAKFDGVKVEGLSATKPANFTAEVPFTVCGRAREDGGKEKVTGQLAFFPEGSYGPGVKAIRARAKVEGFNRERYHISPKHTEGWAARVQGLASVVAEEGSIDLSLIAKGQEQKPAAAASPAAPVKPVEQPAKGQPVKAQGTGKPAPKTK